MGWLSRCNCGGGEGVKDEWGVGKCTVVFDERWVHGESWSDCQWVQVLGVGGTYRRGCGLPCWGEVMGRYRRLAMR